MNSRIDKYLLGLALFMVLPQTLLAAPLWSDVPQADEKSAAASAPSSSIPQLNPHKNSRRVAVSYDQLKATLASASALPAGTLAKLPAAVQLELPMPDGGLKTFNVYESSVMEAGLAARYPQIKTYKAIAASDAGIRGVINIGPNGFRGYLFTPDGEVFIDPVPDSDQQYYSYYKRDYAGIQPKQFSCGVTTDAAASPVAEFESQSLTTLARTSNTLITYRIAVAATGEYSQAVKNSGTTLPAQIKAEALAEITTAISRINQIYERDLAIRLLLVENNDLIVFTNPDTDPYTDPTDPSLLLKQNQTTIDTTLTSAAYDVGHLFGTDSGGLAGLGVACSKYYKAHGESGLSNPVGDPFHIDIVAHEIGHQLGANHSFNGTTESCAYNRNAATAYEPGSGTTIMAYAGICGAENVANYSDATFHAGSIAEIIAFTRNGTGDSCAGSIDTQQQAPTANAGPDYTIPGGTAFALTGTATDPEANAMTYQWDQMDAGIATSKDTYGTDNGSNALFRSFPPVETPARTFPQMATLISILTDKAETLPTENRNLNFRFTARDGNGGVDEDDMQITVDGNAGPFKVLQPNSSLVLNSASLQTIQWNAACTEQLPVNCANVDILYTSDNGTTFKTLLDNTPNNGMAEVNFQNATASKARIKIACSNNIFFDISDVDFALNDGGGITLPTDVIGGSYACGTASGIVNTGDDIEPNNYPAQAQMVSLPLTITGTVNDTLDRDDYFEFVASAAAYTMTLNNFGNYDLDLYLYDYTGKNIIASSEGVTTSETIARNVTPGQTYYLVVNGYNTSGKDSGYTLSVQPRAAFTSDGGGTLSPYGLLLLLIAPLLRHRRAIR